MWEKREKGEKREKREKREREKRITLDVVTGRGCMVVAVVMEGAEFIVTVVPCWRACSSSRLIRRARASSGSKSGSTPNSKPLAPEPLASPMIGLLISTSLRICGPGGTEMRWLLSLLFTLWINASRVARFSTSSPKFTKSTAMPFFLNTLASFKSSSWGSWIGLATKAMILCCWFLFWRCFKANWATCSAFARWELPPSLTVCKPAMILPWSCVGVAKTRGLVSHQMRKSERLERWMTIRSSR